MNETIENIKEEMHAILQDYVMMPNDQVTWYGAEGKLNRFLDILKDNGELYDFAVRCDETNNTPEAIDAAELHLDAAVKLDEDSEFIFIPGSIKPA